MLRPRIIPCLLIKGKGLVKTVRFKSPTYIGDPMNAVRIFNEKQVDELIILDIDATINNRPPDINMIAHISAECRMPLCYGGGINNADQAERIVNVGVEKIAISTAALENPKLVTELVTRIGSQSIVIVLNVRRKIFGGYQVLTKNGKKTSKMSPVSASKMFEELGAGEIVINSIDRDGTMNGYDMDVISQVRNSIHLPITALGGAGSMEHIAALTKEYPIIGAAAGSLFVYKGPHKAVLINYPSPDERRLMSL